MVAWLVAIGSVVGSWALAVAFLAVGLLRDRDQPGHAVVSSCLATLREAAAGRDGVLVQIGLVTLAVAAVAVVVWRLSRSLLRARATTHEHARMTRIAGRHIDGLEAVVLDAPERVAYCVPGRPHTIVLTSAAVDALDARHLDAVLSQPPQRAGRDRRRRARPRDPLATPPRPAQRIRIRLMLAAVSALLAVGPLLTVLLTATGVAMCGPLIG